MTDVLARYESELRREIERAIPLEKRGLLWQGNRQGLELAMELLKQMKEDHSASP